MNELDEAIRRNLQRRAGGTVDPSRAAAITSSIMTGLDEQARARGLRFGSLSVAARLGLAAAVVIAVSLVAVPLAGGPHASTAPSSHGSTAPSSIDSSGLQVLSLDDLQRVVARGGQAPYRARIVIADVDIDPFQPMDCLPAPCGIPAHVVRSNPTITVVDPDEDANVLSARTGTTRIVGPVILRVHDATSVELIGDAPLAVGEVAWPLRSFITAVQKTLRTMEFGPSEFVVGMPYVVEAQLVQGQSFFCPMQTPPVNALLEEFACGSTAWLTPADVSDPGHIVDGWSSRPPDWVRVQGSAYFDFSGHDVPATRTPNEDPVRGFYVVLPVVKFNSEQCFQCDAGAVAILYAKLEPVPIP